MMVQAADIVNELWTLGLVHGDLSPFNIIYINGTVKLIDLQTMHRPGVRRMCSMHTVNICFL